MFGPLITAVPTPFDENNRVNEKLLVKFIHYLANNGSDAIILAGTTGEGTSLSDEEKISMFQTVLANRPKKLKILANVGDNNTHRTIDFIKKIEHLPFDGYMVIVPYYVKPTQKGIFSHFKEIANSTQKPIMIYNVPSRCSVKIEYETVACLISTCSNIKAIKHASNELDMIKELKQNYPKFEVYIGDDKYLLRALRLGADGVVSVIANAYGNYVKELIEDYKKGIENEKLNDYILLISDLMFIETNPAPLKYILTKKGFDFDNIRLPLVKIEKSSQDRISSLLGD